jgi:hypothetical protein
MYGSALDRVSLKINILILSSVKICLSLINCTEMHSKQL